MTATPTSVRDSRLVSLAESHPVAWFFGLALAISWSAWLPAFLLVSDPTSVLMIPGAFGPALAAAATVRLRGGSVRSWLADGLNPRVAKRWYAVALGVPLALGVVLGVALVAVTGAFDPSGVVRGAVTYPLAAAFLAALGGGQEEFGWRGYALPALQARFDALTASVAIGVVWAVWHLPAFAFGVAGYTGSFPLYALLVVGLSVVFTWLYNATGGSVLAAMLLHGGVNAAPSLGIAFTGAPQSLGVSPYVVLVPAVWVVALYLAARYGPETLSARPAETNAGRATEAEAAENEDGTAEVLA